MKILVIGGTGLVGSAVVQELLRRNAAVRLLVRDAKAAVPSGVDFAVGDLLDPPAVDRAMEGADTLYLLNAVTPDELTQGLIAFDLAKRHKFRHIVYHSVFRVESFLDVPHFASKFAIESALRQFEVPWTILRPNYFFQNDETLRDSLTVAGIYPQPLGETGISAVDVRDIAEAAAIALTTEGHEGKVYNLNGPELLSGPNAAAIWSETLGRTVRYGGHDMNAFEAAMREHAPAWSAFDIRMMYQGYLERGFVAEDNDIEILAALLRHAPRTYRAFAREAADKWNAPTRRS
ncbi:MAG: NmrA family NAD(P)-binding protein [Candidatus Eremiobacteraeota bacterium]|nr:NmrA family NAD(P)-binding protein [Candidatus Eremiobacteraeota bacterium]